MRVKHEDRETLPPVTSENFRAAAGLFPTGVSVVARLKDGQPCGMTVSSFTSVSLDPPLILVCIEKTTEFVDGLNLGAAFAVNVLSESQQPISVRFADRTERDRFAGVAWQPGWRGVPLIEGTVANFVCLLDQIVDAGDHFILIGAVKDVRSGEGAPLVWCRRMYHCLPVPPIS